MKTKFHLLALWCVLLCVWGCDATSPSKGDPKTDQGSVADPSVRRLGSPESGTLVRDTIDYDTIHWFTFDVVEDSNYAVAIKVVDKIPDYLSVSFDPPRLKVQIFSQDSTPLADATSGFKRQLAVAKFRASATGTVRIRLEDLPVPDTVAYELRVSRIDGYEVDDYKSAATLIVVGGASQHHTFPAGMLDVDWMRFPTRVGATYQVRTNLEVWSGGVGDGAATSLMLSLFRSKGDEVAQFMAIDTVTYLHLQSPGGIYDTGLVYHVSVVETVGDFEEPNNSFLQAASIDPDAINMLTLAPGDIDYLKFDARIGRSYKVEIERIEVPLRLSFFSEDSSRNLGEMVFDPRRTDTTVFELVPETDRVVVMRLEGTGDGVGYYDLVLRKTVLDPLESGDRLSTAHELVADSTFPLCFVSPGDVDWFRFHADSGSTYTLFHPVDEDRRLVPTLWTADSAMVSAPRFQKISNSRFGFNCGKSGTYYYRVASGDPSRKEHGYRTRLEVNATVPPELLQPDAHEPDSVPGQASILASEVSERTLPFRDVDWTGRLLEAGGVYLLELENTGENSLTCGFHRPDSSLVLSPPTLYAGGKWSTIYKAARSETLLARIAPSWSGTTYRIRMAKIPSEGSAESADFSRAREILPGSPAMGGSWEGSPHWFSTVLDSSRFYLLTLRQSTPSGSCALRMQIVGEDTLDRITSVTGWSGELPFHFKPTRSGKFHVGIGDGANCPDGTAIPYTLSVESSPEDDREPDNTLGMVGELNTMDYFQSYTMGVGDQDIFRLEVDSGVAYSASFAAIDSRHGLRGVLLSADSVVLDTASALGGSEAGFSKVADRQSTWYLKLESATARSEPFRYNLKGKESAPLASRPTAYLGFSTSLDSSVTTRKLRILTGKSTQVQLVASPGQSYELRFRSDVTLRYAVVRGTGNSPVLEGEVGPDRDASIRLQALETVVYSVVFEGAPSRLVNLEAALTIR